VRVCDGRRGNGVRARLEFVEEVVEMLVLCLFRFRDTVSVRA
jgi:hypothetical protein